MFYVGQEVVALRDLSNHSGSIMIKKGETKIILDTANCNCNTPKKVIKVIDNDINSFCNDCKFSFNGTWYLQEYFVPVDYTKAKKVTFEKITEKFPVIANCLLIFVFLCSFVIIRERKYTFKEKWYVYKKMERFLKPIIYSKKGCVCELW